LVEISTTWGRILATTATKAWFKAAADPGAAGVGADGAAVVDDVVETVDLGEDEPPEQAASRIPAPASAVSHRRDRL
jgi:hypothetical protein